MTSFPATLFALTLALAAPELGTNAPGNDELPPTLEATGLYSDFDSRTTAPGVLAFQPRFPLWTDGLEKQRWIAIPAGTFVDAADPNAWVFPVGTQLWKEFALAGRPVETRFMELGESGWRFATYIWSEDGETASLASARGKRGAAELGPGVRHDVPGQFECAACHRGQAQQVLGFSAVQLATGRVAPALPDLADLEALGLVTGSPAHLLEVPTESRLSPIATRALGVFHGNCGHCHNSDGPLVSVGLDLRLGAGFELDPENLAPALRSAVGRPATVTARAAASPMRIEPGDPARSQIVQRMNTRDPLAQMPPLGTKKIDHAALEVLVAWIRDELQPTPEPQQP